ncbi:MAG: 2Fe-2S iron-sulfur cluster binding domain-containing protein [Variovorax sp.]|nr:2Fe-2S iron-sulfur cluster binding domain-containing protein [Variovorax sp.]
MNHRIEIEGAGLAFDSIEGRSVLDAALQAGVELPYSCRKGVCGSCAGRVVSGQVQGVGGVAVQSDVCAPDQVLYCLCEAASDVVLAPLSWKKLDPAARKTFSAKVYSNELAAPDISVLRLRLPAGQRAKFQAGQYLRMRMDDGSTRSYSMANPPHESDGVTLHIRHVPGGYFSTRVARIAPGAVLALELPFGHVALDPEDTRPIVFVAGGTGFAPVKSILDDMMRKRVQRPIALVWGVRDASGLYMRGAVERWRRQWPQLRFIPALSDACDGAQDIQGVFMGRADQALQSAFDSLADHVIHCCGSPPMVAAVRAAALAQGASAEDFHADVFVPGPAT